MLLLNLQYTKKRQMKLRTYKYIIGCFLALLFVFSGLEYVTPLYHHATEQSSQPNEPTKETESSDEKSGEKLSAGKEFVDQLHNEFPFTSRYAIVSTIKPRHSVEHMEAIFMPVTTPPPES